jgi:ribonuclease D
MGLSMTEKDWRTVASAADLTALLEAVRGSEAVAIDTEFIPEKSYSPRLCLIQIATKEGIWIVDPLAVPELGDFWQALTEPPRELVAVGARQEIVFCIEFAGRPPAKMIDLQPSAGLVGFGYPLSHVKLIHKVLGVHLRGGETFTDWTRRPLAARQLRYAADDVRHLLPARDRIMSEAQRLGRVDWIEAECRKGLGRIAAEDREESWRRVSGSSGLDARGAAVVREIWRWRDRKARETNRPARWVLPDHLVVGIAQRRPVKLEDLEALRGMERVSRRAGPELIAAVERGLALPEAELPPVVRRSDPPQVAALAQLLSAVSQMLAAQHRIEPSLLATTADLQELVRWRLGLLAPDSRPALLEGWREAILGKPLLDVMDGRRSVRVADVTSRNPLALDEGAAN